jgi:hypothetical protein
MAEAIWNQEPRQSLSRGGRSVQLDWLLRTEPDGGMGGREKRTYATLTVRYNQGGANMFSGRNEMRCYEASIGQQTEEDSDIGGVMRGFQLFGAVGIWRGEEVGRFSKKKLEEAVPVALAKLREFCEANDSRIVIFFDDQGD